MSVGQKGHKVCMSHIDAHPRRIIQMWKRSHKTTQKCTILGLKLVLYVNNVKGKIFRPLYSELRSACQELCTLYFFQRVQSVYTYFLN